MSLALFWRRVTILTVATCLTLGLLLVATSVSAEEETETYSVFHELGQVIELASTEKPTFIVLRVNPTGEFTDYTISITNSTYTIPAMDSWMVGDYLNVRGLVNDNTNVVGATTITNTSFNLASHEAFNGWVDSIAADGSTVGVQWNNEVRTLNINENSHLVGDNGPHGSIDDFQVGDRVRLRLDVGSDNIRIMMILRRGPNIFNLARTNVAWAYINDIDTENDVMNVVLARNDHLTDGDVNNLMGVEGDYVTVTYDENTRIVRRYFGVATEDELTPGDWIYFVSSLQNDGTAHASMIKDNSIWAFGVAGHVGDVLEVNTDENYLVVTRHFVEDRPEWTLNYDDDTKIYVNGSLASEDEFAVDMLVRVRGVANVTNHTIDVASISARDLDVALEHYSARITDILENVEQYESAS
ncbi:MAG: hypothetical protein ABH846_01080 [Patescibacteria group bacterium]